MNLTSLVLDYKAKAQLKEFAILAGVDYVIRNNRVLSLVKVIINQVSKSIFFFSEDLTLDNFKIILKYGVSRQPVHIFKVFMFREHYHFMNIPSLGETVLVSSLFPCLPFLEDLYKSVSFPL